jgi:ATP-dependent Clp protease ATP-binding subunit ClpC
LGLLRESKALAGRVSRPGESGGELVRKQIEAHTTVRQVISTAVDRPITGECQVILAYAAEEAERLSHEFIGTDHLLLGLLREPNCFAAKLLHEEGSSSRPLVHK